MGALRAGRAGDARASVWARLAGMCGFVAAGGAIGTTARAQLESAFAAGPGEIAWTTLIINVAGSFALGLFLELMLHAGLDTGWRRALRLGCGTGLLGGFTTYSAFVLEIDQLARDGQVASAAGYAVGSVLLGLAAAGLGLATVQLVTRRRRRHAAGGAR
ncbi:FluC/FEX family fluoride channel [Georgenia alba]|uniref:Fluoride-specific ion channel FluC n=1 Tax=Georgenia alba TaxID=2233858 RepID=A0ABW2Q2Y5_9MICO